MIDKGSPSGGLFYALKSGGADRVHNDGASNWGKAGSGVAGRGDGVDENPASHGDDGCSGH